MIRKLAIATVLSVAIAPLAAAQGGYSWLSNLQFGQEFAVDVDRAGEFPGAIYMRKSTGEPGQYIWLEEMGDGSLEIYTQLTGNNVCMTLFDQPRMRNGTLIAMSDCEEDEPRQRWIPVFQNNGAMLTTQFSGPGQCLTLNNAGTSDQWYAFMAPCNAAADQIWTLAPAN